MSVPTGSITNPKFPYTFTVPSGVQTVAITLTLDVSGGTYNLNPLYIGVTPGSTHKLKMFSYQSAQEMVFGLECGTHDIAWTMGKVPFREFNSFTCRSISFSPEINTHTPCVTDY